MEIQKKLENGSENLCDDGNGNGNVREETAVGPQLSGPAAVPSQGCGSQGLW